MGALLGVLLLCGCDAPILVEGVVRSGREGSIRVVSDLQKVARTSATENPVGGATITLSHSRGSRTAVTDAEGRFRLEGVTSHSWFMTLHAGADGYEEQSRVLRRPPYPTYVVVVLPELRE